MVVVRKKDKKIMIELTQREYDEFRNHLGNYLSIFNPSAKDMTLGEYIAFPMSKVCADIEEGFNKIENYGDYDNRMMKKLGKEWYKMV